MQKCLLISFDFPRFGYHKTSYAIACILARFYKSDIVDIEHYQYDLISYLSTPQKQIELIINNDFREKYFEKINNYSFVTLSTYSWSENLVNLIIGIIRPVFKGKIILGGYEITALREEELYKVYPGADYYLKGYVEKSLEQIFKNAVSDIVINEKPDDEDFISPYLSGIIPINENKIYWESKKGCIYKCDFCEWGNATHKLRRINEDRINKEIELFKKYNIQEINVLDGIFLTSNEDLITLEKLLSIKKSKITLQMHFSTIKNELGKEFLHICQKYKDRISLEFGLQTIHKDEMEVLNRKNDIEQVKVIMKELKESSINYEISIIFGIPGQTVKSFRETIDFINENGCEKWRAFPLRLPNNSKMKKKKKELGVKEHHGEHFPIEFVKESSTFNEVEWKKMYEIVKLHENIPPFCGDPIEKTIPIIDKITQNYLFGGIKCIFRENITEITYKNNIKKSFFWM